MAGEDCVQTRHSGALVVEEQWSKRSYSCGRKMKFPPISKGKFRRPPIETQGKCGGGSVVARRRRSFIRANEKRGVLRHRWRVCLRRRDRGSGVVNKDNARGRRSQWKNHRAAADRTSTCAAHSSHVQRLGSSRGNGHRCARALSRSSRSRNTGRCSLLNRSGKPICRASGGAPVAEREKRGCVSVDETGQHCGGAWWRRCVKDGRGN